METILKDKITTFRQTGVLFKGIHFWKKYAKIELTEEHGSIFIPVPIDWVPHKIHLKQGYIIIHQIKKKFILVEYVEPVVAKKTNKRRTWKKGLRRIQAKFFLK